MWGRNKKEEAKRKRNEQMVHDVLSGIRLECSHINLGNPINQTKKMAPLLRAIILYQLT